LKELSWVYYSGLVIISALFIKQFMDTKNKKRDACFKAFLDNNWVGLVIFISILGHYALQLLQL